MFFSSGGGVFLCPLAYLHRGVTSNSTHKPDSSVISAGLSFSTLLPSRFFQFPSDLLAGSLSLLPSNCLETPLKWSSSSIPSVYPDPLMSSGAFFRYLHTDKELSTRGGGGIWLKVMERWQAKPGGRWRMMMKAGKLRWEWWFERGADGMSRRQKKKRKRRGKARGQWNGQVHKVNYRFRQGVLMFKGIQAEGEKRDKRLKGLKQRTASHLLTEAALLNTLLSVISPCFLLLPCSL